MVECKKLKSKLKLKLKKEKASNIMNIFKREPKVYDATVPKFVRLQWCDSAGVRRCRIVVLPSNPGERSSYLERLKVEGVGLTKALMAFPVFADMIAPESGLSASGEIRLLPDTESFRQLPWRSNHAVMQTFMKDPLTGEAWGLCPRTALKRALESLAEVLPGASIKAGFETEFLLLRSSDDAEALPKPVDTDMYCSTRAVEDQSSLLDEIVMSLETLGMEVEQLHKEAAPGQYEMVVKYKDVMEACDDLLVTRDTICAIAKKRGLIASFVPKFDMAQCGNGGHVHLSLWVDGENLFSKTQGLVDLTPTFHPAAEGFVAGILEHLPALLCVTTPSTNSFRRQQAGFWTGAYKCWGMDNREAPIRFPTPPSRDHPVTNFEVKTMDATACPYIALAGLIAAGRDGIAKELKLPPPCQEEPSTMKNAQAAGITRLPSNVSEAVQALRSAEAEPLRAVLGEELVQAFCSVRECEADFFKDKDFETEVKTVFRKY